MADIQDFFNEYLPHKLTKKPSLAGEINIYVFDIEGAGQWTVDLAVDGGEVRAEGCDDAGCVVTAKSGLREASTSLHRP